MLGFKLGIAIIFRISVMPPISPELENTMRKTLMNIKSDSILWNFFVHLKLEIEFFKLLC